MPEDDKHERNNACVKKTFHFYDPMKGIMEPGKTQTDARKCTQKNPAQKK